MKSHRLRTAATLAALALLLPAASLRAEHDRRVLVAVFDPASNHRLIALESGQTLQLRPGEAVRLQLIDPAWDNARQQHQEKVGGRFDVVGTGAVIKLSQENQAEGTVLVSAAGAPRNGNPVRLTFDPHGNGVSGSLLVEVNGAANAASVFDRLRTAPSTTVAGAGSPYDAAPASDRAQDLVVSLYRGVLLREPDPSAANYTETLRRDGLDRFAAIAREVATSRESTVDVPRRASAEQRLTAMYQNLLHRDPRQVSASDWQRGLDMLSRGDIATLVDTFVRSQEFASAHGLEQRLAATY